MIHRSLCLGICILLALYAPPAAAAPDRDSLLAACESHMANLPGTIRFESVGDGVYRLEDAELPYAGELKIIGILVRPADNGGLRTEFSHFGMVDFELSELAVERMTSQTYYYWLADRQTLHYSSSGERWVDTATYNTALASSYGLNTDFGMLSFMLNYGVWLLLVPLVVVVFAAVNRQSKKARALMDETAAINQRARENLDRAASMQDEVVAVARQTRDLQADNNELLKQLIDVLKR
jgi:ABC-type multidrug transport system fused ATPase/permease subunit